MIFAQVFRGLMQPAIEGALSPRSHGRIAIAGATVECRHQLAASVRQFARRIVGNAADFVGQNGLAIRRGQTLVGKIIGGRPVVVIVSLMHDETAILFGQGLGKCGAAGWRHRTHGLDVADATSEQSQRSKNAHDFQYSHDVSLP